MPKLRDSVQDELVPEFKCQDLYGLQYDLAHLKPSERRVCQGYLEKGRFFKKLNKILFGFLIDLGFLISGKLAPFLGGRFGQSFLTSYVDRVRSPGRFV